MLKNVKIFLIIFTLFIAGGIGVGIYVYNNHNPKPKVIVETPNDILSNYQTEGTGVSAKVSAKYTTHNVTKHMLNGNENSINLGENSNSQLNLQDNNIWLTKDNPDILIEYKFQNLSQNPIFIELDNRLNLDNANITYNVSDIPVNQSVMEQSLLRQVLPKERTKYIYVKISIKNDAVKTLFNGEICWDLYLAEVNITLNHDNNTKSDTVSVKYGEEIPPVEIPSKNMNIFDGYISKDGNKYIDIFGQGSKIEFVYDTELIAQYKHVNEVFELDNETKITALKEEYSDLTYINIPEGITEISNEAFKDNESLETVILPKSLNTLGDSAFYNCANLKQVTIKDGLTTLGTSAFEKCVNLSTVTLPNSLISTGSRVFFNTPKLKNIDLPDGLQSIDLAAFTYSGLSNIELPNSLKSIGQSAFQDCDGLTTITIPSSVERIDRGAFGRSANLKEVIFEEDSKIVSISNSCFAQCASLMSINIPQNIQSIEDYAFDRCEDLEIDLDLFTSLISIGDYAFNYCTSLKGNLVFPSTLTSIGTTTFQGCYKIKSVTLNEGLQTIGDYAFYLCSGIGGELVVPSTVTSIGTRAFLTSSTFTDVVVAEENSNYYSSKNGVNYHAVISNDGMLIQGCNLSTIPSDVKVIGDGAFYQCTGLTSITMPDTVTKVGYAAFYNCTGLKSVNLPSSLTIIDNFAFGRCTSLKIDLIIPSGVTSIGVAAFEQCKITSLTFNEGLLWIGDAAFNHCELVTNSTITIPSTLVQIGGQSYIGDNEQNSIIGTHVFYNCATKYLTRFEVASGNTHFKADENGVLYTINNKYLIAYPSANEMTEYSILEGCERLFEMAMSRPYNLNTLYIPDSLALEYSDSIPPLETEAGRLMNPLQDGIYIYNAIDNFVVNSTNPNYKSVNGIIYSKDGTRVIAAPTRNHVLEDGKKVLRFEESAITIENIFYLGGDFELTYNGICVNGKPDIIEIGANIASIHENVITNLNTMVDEHGLIIKIDSNNEYYKLVNGKIKAKNSSIQVSGAPNESANMELKKD